MQHVKVFTTDLVKSLQHWEPIQASEHPQFKWLPGPVYLNRYAKFIAIPQATHVKNNACFISDLKLFTHFDLGLTCALSMGQQVA